MYNKITLKEVVGLADPLIDQIPKQSTYEEILYYSYFFSLIDLASEINFLNDNNRHNSLSIITRSFLETFVDFMLISKDIQYSHTLILKARKEQKNQTEFLLQNGDIDQKEREILRKRLKTLKEEVEERKPFVNDSNKISGIWHKFELVNLTWLYKTIYTQLCSFSHNSIDQIEQRHISTPNDSKVVLKYKIEDGVRSSELFLSVTLTCFIDSLKTLNEKSRLDCSKIIDEIERREKEA